MVISINFHNNHFNTKLTHIAGDLYLILGSGYTYSYSVCPVLVSICLKVDYVYTTVAANYCTNFPLGNSIQGYYDYLTML